MWTAHISAVVQNESRLLFIYIPCTSTDAMSGGQDSHRPCPHLFSTTVGYSQSSLTWSTLFIESRSPRRKRGRAGARWREGKRKRLQCSQDMRLFLGTINQDGVDRRGPPPPAEPVWGGSAGLVWNDSTSLCWSMGQWRSTQLSQRAQRTAKLFQQHNTPSTHSPWSKKAFKHTRTCSRTPGERSRVYVCVWIWDSFAFFETV